jgi:hypothetical protein
MRTRPVMAEVLDGGSSEVRGAAATAQSRQLVDTARPVSETRGDLMRAPRSCSCVRDSCSRRPSGRRSPNRRRPQAVASGVVRVDRERMG